MLYPELAHDLTLALDRARFMRSVGLEPDKWQADFLKSEAERVLLNCSRQSGKSTVTSVLAVHKAKFRAGSLTLLISPSLRQSLELYAKVVDVYLATGGTLDDVLATELRLPNGSRIASLPSSEKTIRGFSKVDLLICDEASRIDDALYYAVSPMLAVSGGRLIMLSTPFGKRGVFHDLWVNSPDYEKIMITADKCPRISKAFLESEKRSMPSRTFRQEYFCEFLQTDDAIFSYDDVIGMVSDDIMPLFAGENYDTYY